MLSGTQGGGTTSTAVVAKTLTKSYHSASGRGKPEIIPGGGMGPLGGRAAMRPAPPCNRRAGNGRREMAGGEYVAPHRPN